MHLKLQLTGLSPKHRVGVEKGVVVVRALLVLSTFLVKKSSEKKSEVWKQNLMFSQRGCSVLLAANYSMWPKTGISCL